MADTEKKHDNNNAPVPFRSEAMKSLSSTEDLDRYVKATGPAAWLVVGAAVALLAAWLVWAALTAPEEGAGSLLTILFGGKAG